MFCLTSLCRRPTGKQRNGIWSQNEDCGCHPSFIGIFGLSSGQESAPTNQAIAPSVGLEVGQQAPAFALSDQFGHQRPNETLKGSKGTVLLFFRSADW